MKTLKKNKKSIIFKQKCNILQKMKFSKLKRKNIKKYSKIKGGAVGAVSTKLIYPNIKTNTLASGPFIERKAPILKPSIRHKVDISILEKIESIKSEINNFFNTHRSNQKNNETTGEFSKLFELIEVTNSFFQLKYNYYNDKNEYKPLFLFINPDILSVDKLQYFIDNNKIKPSINGENIQISENTITIQSLKAGGQYRTGDNIQGNKYVYEDSRIELVTYEENLRYLMEQENGKYYINTMDVKIDPPNPNLISVIAESIAWIREIVIDLNTVNPILNVNNETKKNLELFLEKSKTDEGKNDYIPRIFSCVELDVDHSKIIIEKVTTLEEDEEYVIVGYPKDTMRSYLDLYNKNKVMFDAIYEKHKSDFMTSMAELHNFINPNNTIDMDQLTTEINKFYGYESYYLYIENFYNNELLKLGYTQEQINTVNFYSDLTDDKKQEIQDKFIEIYGIPYDPEFQSKFKELQKAFYNELASKCLNKPMLNINYVFLIFKKNSDGNYTPAVFNFRELKHKYHSLLQRLETVIKTILPYIYGITTSQEEEYRLWYSRYNYGNIFHIKTEYVHTMSNIQQQAYKYNNSITLEELIYMLSISDIDLKNLRIEYVKKTDIFSKIDGEEIKFNVTSEEIKTKYKIYIEPVSVPPITLELSTLLQSKILLMFVETGKLYTFIYEKDGKFNIIKFKPKIYNIIIAIFEQLRIHILNEEFMTKILNSRNNEFIEAIDIPEIDLYEVVEHRLINSDDYKSIMRYNPLLVRTIKKKTNEPTIIISEFFDSPLVKASILPNIDIVMPNPYSKKPLIIRNFLATKEYREKHNEFMTKYRQKPYNYFTKNTNLLHKPNLPKYVFNFVGDNYNNEEINAIYFNPEKCGYNLIAIKEETKTVVWIVPFNSTYSENIEVEYLGNFLDLKIKHIKVLQIVNRLYFNNNNSCFMNISSITPPQLSLHIHVINDDIYKSNFATLEQGSRIAKMLSTKIAINLLNLNTQYFENYKTEILIHDKL